MKQLITTSLSLLLLCATVTGQEKTHLSNFANAKDYASWTYTDRNNTEIKLAKGRTGLIIKSAPGYPSIAYYTVPAKAADMLSITTSVSFAGKETPEGHGFIWNVKDQNNFAFFLISNEGFFSVGEVKDGKKISKLVIPELGLEEGDPAPESKSSYDIKKESGSLNTIKMVREEDGLTFYINGEYAYNTKKDVLPIENANVGLVNEGSKEVFFKNLVITTKN